MEVMYDHTREHLFLDMPDGLNFLFHFFVGVPIFFMLSGYLIWQSAGRSSNYFVYLKKRFWRIYPELWVAVAIEIIAILILYQQSIDYPRLGLFIIGQATIFQFWTPDFLRGYGCGCPNGALWTICVLIQFYFLAYLLYKWLHGKKTILWGVSILATIAVSIFTPFVQEWLGNIGGKLYGVTIIPFLWMFLLAAFYSEKKEIILPLLKNCWPYLLLMLLIVRVLHVDFHAGYNAMDSVLLFSGLLGLAYDAPNVNVKKDVSYGIYIYHMTVVNILISFDVMYNKWLMVLVVGLTLLIAYLSTETVGKWSLRMKSKYNRRKPPVLAF